MTTKHVHTAECDTYRAKLEADRVAYAAKYPNHCRTCGGWGGFHVAQTYWEPADFDVCDDCVGQDRCPRCSTTLELRELGEYSDELYCPVCGWTDSVEDGDPTFHADRCICPDAW